jgi:hypothetical protein
LFHQDDIVAQYYLKQIVFARHLAQINKKLTYYYDYSALSAFIWPMLVWSFNTTAEPIQGIWHNYFSQLFHFDNDKYK